MLKIGTFSKLSRLSIRTLRRYDELGLLQPVHTDPFTGYRYYREGAAHHGGAHRHPAGHGLRPVRHRGAAGGRRTGGADRRLAEQQRALEALLAGDEAAAAPPGHGPCTVEKG